MTVEKAIYTLQELAAKSNTQSEIKRYKKFIEILRNLQKRVFTESQRLGIEEKLASLKLNADENQGKRHMANALKKFKGYLKDKLSLTTQGYFAELGIGLGASFGVLFGLVVLSNFERSLGISYGIALGLLIGLIIGRNLDAQAKAAGKTV